MALNWVSALPLHWVDEIENQKSNYVDAPREDLPEWMNVDLPGGQDLPASYGTHAVVEHILDHRKDYDYDEFDRQLGVILENEAQWINDSLDSANLMGVDSSEIQSSYDQERSSFVGLVNMIETRGFNVPTRGYEAMETLNADGYMSREYGSFGRKFAKAVVNDVSRERVISGRVPIPDDLGIDFTRPAELSPEVTRSLTTSYDLERIAQRSAALRTALRQELDSITGPVDENSSIARSIDTARVEPSEGLPMSQAEKDLSGDETVGILPLSTQESIEELLEEIDARERDQDKGTDSPSL